MRRVPLTSFGWLLIWLLVIGAVAGVAGAGTLATVAVVIGLILLLGALGPVSSRHVQTRSRLRPPEIPWMRRRSRHPPGDDAG